MQQLGNRYHDYDSKEKLIFRSIPSRDHLLKSFISLNETTVL